MANIFKLTKEYVDAPKRNVYDLSYTTNLTAKFGLLYPVFVKETNPGDSFSIGTNFGLRAEPMVFPVQSAIRADIHYFYVRNRTLWENWMDFYGKLDDTLIHPYINQVKSFYKSKTLADYLGVPTSQVGGTYVPIYYPANPYSLYGDYRRGNFSQSTLVSFSSSDDSPSIDFNRIRNQIVNSLNSRDYEGVYTPSIPFSADLFSSETLDKWNKHIVLVDPSEAPYKGFFTPYLPIDTYYDGISSAENGTFYPGLRALFAYDNSISPWQGYHSGATTIFYRGCMFFSKTFEDRFEAREISNFHFVFSINVVGNTTYVMVAQSDYNAILSYLSEAKTLGNTYCMFLICFSSNAQAISSPSVSPNASSGYYSFGNVFYFPEYKVEYSADVSDVSDVPWVGVNAPLKINALPFRAYEAIYNSYYRNYMNNPFILNGKPQYNRYVTNLGSGPDSTPYKLQKRNWELDFLTSAVQSPQQGEAPLIGITVSNSDSTATFKFQSEELKNLGVANGEVTANVTVDDDGTMVGMNYVDPRLPQSNIDRLMEAINYGISINDIRNVNSLQRWLEKNIRRGYRYIDQLKSHFGVEASYKDLLMPEFIGGCSFKIDTNTISQTTPTSDSPLGAYGGQAFARGNSEHNVTKYCDEAGFIIGIMSIVPTPVYSQVPNQFLFKENVLDYYFPEFGKIGMQPIYKRDITPLQTESDKLFDVFGYQRPWWHLISSVDEVHGEFRTNRQGYLIQRLFKDTPILNGDFLTIDNSSINNVFYVDDTVSDQFLGQIHFSVSKKTAIPLHGIPQID